MGSAPCDGPGRSDGSGDIPLAPFKILIAGGFGVGKTTLVGAISEVRPLRTEEALAQASVGTDDLTGVGRKTTTTVAMDFGRLTMGTHLVLYLFGTPGQERFRFMRDELSFGALGAVVVADTRGWATVSLPSTTSRGEACHSSSPSTASTALPATTRRTCASRLTSARGSRPFSATPVSAARSSRF